MNIEADFARIMSVRDSGECSSSGTADAAPPLRLYTGKYFGPPTGIGGLIIDHRGKCVKGFMKRLRVNMFGLVAEILAVYQGLVLLNDMDEKGTYVYISEAALESMLRIGEERYPDSGDIYSKTCQLFKNTQSNICSDPVSRAYGEPAEWLAKRAVTRNTEFEVFKVPPHKMQILFPHISESADENANRISESDDEI